MTPVTSTSLVESNHIRRLDISQDLDVVADLIETCFPIHLDQDGQDYIREMRKAARDIRMMRWLSTMMEMGDTQVSGFVWEEDNRIVGNLSLIPFKSSGVDFHMIANVAVHPDFRRRGIARALTEQTLVYLRKEKEPYVWLQVREDNPTACELYQSAGFVEQAARTTWRIRPNELENASTKSAPKLTIYRRQREDWIKQKTWLWESYPALLRWNLPVDFRSFEPGCFQGLLNFLNGNSYHHWAYKENGYLQGLITWQKTNRYANNLWLAFPEDGEDEILPRALTLGLKRVSRKHPLSVDYPRGRCQQVFSGMGFHRFRTLIWMRCDL